jgi:hypothetical protein
MKTLTPMSRAFSAAALFFSLGAAAHAQVPNIYKYIEPRIPFDEASARAQLEPGASVIRGTISVKENKALIKALNISKSHVAPRGAVVTLMPHSAYLDEWLALDKKLRRRAGLEKAALSAQANSYRILTRVLDDGGTFEFKNLKPGKYFIYADVNYVETGSSFVQTGTETTSNAVTSQVLDSRAVGYYEPFAVDVSKMVTAVVTVPAGGQLIEAKIRGQ